ncbi:type VI secretion system tip protein TssI/VgrG [Burkholderia cepacia]|uniref:type VI secretion system tip protein TssI/VgrG n=2 Tax=Burkholderia cepacia TaxID=292 RepID=UPI001E35501E|nr:type VI secretion system tip protein TssI/VgrG [Burkholderia cepacia]
MQHDTGFRRTRYSAVVEPRLARLKLSSDWRIFQTLSAPEIATGVLKAHNQTLDYEQRVTNEHLAREYCVQAGDTDYDFIERILREEGFFYAFQHKADGHRLIHCDRLFIYGRQQGEPVLYNPTPGGDQRQPCLRTFAYTENVRTARQVQRDYTFKSPRFPHEYPREGTDLDHQGRGYARYDYPGRYKHEASGKAFTQDRLRGHRRDARIARVNGDDARLQPGTAFDLIGHPREDMNRGWRPVSIVHHGVQYTSQAEEGADAQQGTHYRYEAVLVPDDAEWRAEPLPRPRIDGPQPATVVGPEGEEIYTDAYGRVKVQFPWDREGKYDEHSSCWIQVAQNWAGATWGHMAIPRIGQEVIVVNLDGDPDQPLIIGRAYNRLQLPPYELPRHKTRMTIKSQTHKGEGYNELRFEDEKDQEEIYVHAQKDQNIHVNHDETTFVGNDRSEQVEHDETIAIGNDRKETVGRDEQVTIGQDRRHDIGQDDFLSIGRNHTIHTGKDRTEEVGNHRRDKTAANHTVDIGGHLKQRVAGHAELEAGQAIRYPSEWKADKKAWDAYDALIPPSSRAAWEAEKARIAQLVWWDAVAGKVKDFPVDPFVYHIHPVAHIGNLMKSSATKISEKGLWFIYKQEANSESRQLHWPGGSSGVTLGPGYDMSKRSAAEVRRDMITIGMNEKDATHISAAAGLAGDAARNFAKDNKTLVVLAEAQEYALLRYIVPQYEERMRQYVDNSLSQHEYDAMVCYAYNSGGGLGKVAVLVNEDKFDEAANLIKKYVYSAGRRVSGLEKRRDDESNLLLHGRYEYHGASLNR